MAEQINDKWWTRAWRMRKSGRYNKRQHHREKRRQAKDINKPHPMYNRYSDGWFL